MRIDYSDNSFMLSWDRIRAWYRPDGSLSDCEYKRWRGKLTTSAVSSKHVKVIAYLERQGIIEIDLLNRGILKRKFLKFN